MEQNINSALALTGLSGWARLLMSDEFIISEHYVILSLLGYSLNEVYADLLQFNFTTSLWSEVYLESPKPVSPNIKDF